MQRPTNRQRRGFTLIELFAALSILAILAGVLLPAVQQTRELSRRVSCANRLKQQSLALLAFESTYKHLPAGAEPQTLHAWSSRILPFLEQANRYHQIDFQIGWNSGSNRRAIHSSLPVYKCPSSWKDYPGASDYSGIRGSSHNARSNLGRNGVLFPILSKTNGIRLSEITDGTSQTLAIAEAVALGEDSNGFWASGLNCIGHDEGPINNRRGSRDEIASLHPGGANVALADGSTRFLNQSLSLQVLGALCTRGNGEVTGSY
ncbi:MAG: DUF1559 domain-containing protein [Planctomycetota bacterium]